MMVSGSSLLIRGAYDSSEPLDYPAGASQFTRHEIGLPSFSWPHQLLDLPLPGAASIAPGSTALLQSGT